MNPLWIPYESPMNPYEIPMKDSRGPSRGGEEADAIGLSVAFDLLEAEVAGWLSLVEL